MDRERRAQSEPTGLSALDLRLSRMEADLGRVMSALEERGIL